MKGLTDDALAKILWDFNCLYNPLQKADCIIVFGSNDTRVAKRGVEIFLQGYASLLIFSGGVGKLTKKFFSKSEAETFAEVALEMGVPKEKVLIEGKSTNSGENILFTKKLLEDKKIRVNKLILVQKPYMQRRVFATFKKLWPEKEILVTAPVIPFEEYPNELLPKDLVINILVGDTQRIIEYPKMGYQVLQRVSENVQEAYQELVARGYTKHLI